jgi:MoxR-like ATPase
MTPNDLKAQLALLISNKISLSTMIWGPPGIGKSSVVAQLASEHGLQFVDVRLSQLAPTDLRGLPVPENGVSRWYPPEFLPREGRGILFLDELNMAPPALQGIAQQLILDRKVGSYTVPDGWFIWAAGNRKEDRASVFDMPTPLGNRFLHFDVGADFESFKAYAIEKKLHEQVIAFLSYRPTLLHKIDIVRPAWPSPRSWEMASRLHQSGIPVACAVGDPTAEEFAAFLSIYEKLTSIDEILAGQARRHTFPDEPSMRYALTVGLSLRPKSKEEALNAFSWLVERTTAEWVQLFIGNVLSHLETINAKGTFILACRDNQRLWGFINEANKLPFVSN